MRALTAALVLALAASGGPAAAQTITTLPDSTLPRKDDKTYLPDDWLLGSGQPWHFRLPASATGAPLGNRAPNAAESALVDAARSLVARYDIKLVALLDGERVVDLAARPGIGPSTLLLSASMGKTVTAIAAGKAVCAGLLRLDTTLGSVAPALRDTDFGRATLRDLLTMTSGVAEPPPRNATGIGRDEQARYIEGDGALEELLSSPRHATAHRDSGRPVGPGRRFSYKSVDPLAVSVMLARATGMPAARWVEQQVLRAVPIGDAAVLGTNRRGEFVGAEGNVRMTLSDWLRFAAWVQARRGEAGCFGDFLRALGTTQVRIPLIDGINGYFDGYGYFAWTANRLAPETFWAVGYGGQRIGWSTDPGNRRMFVTFANGSDKDMNAIYPVASRWIRGR